ncbi:MAG: low molecular weight phosphotyrosine protein phosphatase [Flavobacteriales bacterium]|nr:low molecular weight phosphotyrosine protein phosphatase [Flavobacteriales bacterium]MBK6894003.1 low molecular weight phosphotyrosine protein phosphatase [Flavobacteriales bacterium]MBK9060868.1 low molecular weight phosphotyrosine protein phosphatase [Flavobacteriales bacterium]
MSSPQRLRQASAFQAKKILLVCLGNICRSPMAEGLLREMAKQRGLDIQTDSAGTGNSHLGQAPDPRAQAEMRKHGMDISDLRARLFTRADFERFDLLLAMDRYNLKDMQRLSPSDSHAAKARLMLDWSPDRPGSDVPDPWFGGSEGFGPVHDMLQEAMDALLDEIEHEG